jgi:soluble lytic murein transglycosylase-like protein
MRLINGVRLFILVCILAFLSGIGITLANASVPKTRNKIYIQDLSIKAKYSFVDDYEVTALTKYVQKRSKVKLSEHQANVIVTSAISSGNKLKIDPTLVLAVAEVESEFNPKAKSDSSSAYGLMQVIPYWHKEKIRNRDMRQAKDQIVVGAEVLAEYIESGGSVKAALKLYSGGSSKYATKVIKTRNRIRLHVMQEVLNVAF